MTTNLITPSNTPSNTPSITPSSTPCPIYPCKCLNLTNNSIRRLSVVEYTNCDGVLSSVPIGPLGNAQVCGSNPILPRNVDVYIGPDCQDGECTPYQTLWQIDPCCSNQYVGLTLGAYLPDDWSTYSNVFYSPSAGQSFSIYNNTIENPDVIIDAGIIIDFIEDCESSPVICPTSTPTPTMTPTPTTTPSITPTMTQTPTQTPTQTRTPTQTPSNTPSNSPSPLSCQTLQVCSDETSGDSITVNYVDCNNIFHTITVYWTDPCFEVCAKSFSVYGGNGTAAFIGLC